MVKLLKLLLIPILFCNFSSANDLVVPNDKNLLFFVNMSAKFGHIDAETLEITYLADLPYGGSAACAYDADNERIYIQSNNHLYYFDLKTAEFTHLNNGSGFSGGEPWLEYDHLNKILYSGASKTLYTINPSTGQRITTTSIKGFVGSGGGGDVAFSTDNTLYISPSSGLYTVNTNITTGNNAVRISSESLSSVTAMTIDHNDIVWATSNSGRKLIKLDIETGHTSTAASLNFVVNDLTDRPKDEPEICPDSDGDGLDDCSDPFPNDAEACGANYSPSENGLGTLAFEDMWPKKGDYDFNDLVINYRTAVYTKCDTNKTRKMEMKFAVSALGATFRNGFGIELPINESLIEKVEGVRITRGLVNLDSRNLEIGHDKAVIIVFDNAFDNMGESLNEMTRTDGNQVEVPLREIHIKIRFKEDISSSLLTDAPFNPFIFVHKKRGREVHLPGKSPTALADLSLFGTEDDRTDLSNSYTYKNKNGLPWAINIPHKFRVPKERNPIDQAYTKFINFVTSLNNEYSDWYSDNQNYRENSKIFIPGDDQDLFLEAFQGDKIIAPVEMIPLPTEEIEPVLIAPVDPLVQPVFITPVLWDI